MAISLGSDDVGKVQGGVSMRHLLLLVAVNKAEIC